MRDSVSGLLAAVQSFGNLAASAIAGLLWTLASPQVAFLYFAPGMLASLAALALIRGPSDQATKRPSEAHMSGGHPALPSQEFVRQALAESAKRRVPTFGLVGQQTGSKRLKSAWRNHAESKVREARKPHE
jgi:dipeptide/tripeptide permease